MIHLIIGEVSFAFIILGIFLMWWFGKFPSSAEFTHWLDALNTRGGNILILFIGTLLGTSATMRLFYYIIQLSVDGKVMQDNAFALMGLTFLSGTITGGFLGALLKTMTGESTPSKSEPVKE